MFHLEIILLFIWFLIIQLMSVNIFGNIIEPADNETKFKDMYVIKATTYQVGILTNDTHINDNSTGDQVAITFYSANGSDMDLNNIPPPMLTNVTGERMIAVAPVTKLNNSSAEPWMHFDDIIYGNKSTFEEMHNAADKSKIESRNRSQNVARSNKPSSESDDCGDYDCSFEEDNVYKRSVENQSDVNIMGSDEPIVKLFEGSAIIPQNASINALYLPPLLNFQSNLSVLPVPIPNTSVVHYSKIDTLVKSTQT